MAEPDVESTEIEEAPAPEGTSAGETEREEEEELSPFLQKLKAPIDDDEPAGKKVTYDDDFQQLKTQINEIGAASGGADYERIVELGRKILTEKSKDLRAAGYLVVGEARLNGTPGMAEAVKGIRLLIDTFWEELYPAKRRMRGRGRALQFISDRLGDWIESAEFDKDDRVPLQAARSDLKAVQDFALEAMGEHAPSLSGLLKKFDKAIKKLPAPEPESKAEPKATEEEDGKAAATAPSQKKSTRTSAEPAEIASNSDAEGAIARAATFFRTEDKTNPIPYRLMRIIRWGELQKAPPNEGGTTRMEAPRGQRRDYLSGLLEQEEYETLVEEGESTFQAGSFHFWLDLQRLLASAMRALGKPYEDARTAVMLDTALLVQRVPTLPTLAFSDGTPFASPLTTEWLEMQAQPLLGTDGKSSTGRAATDDSMPAAEDYEEARQRLTSGDLAGALDRMEGGAAQDTTQKERFYRRLYVATLCLKGGKPAVALPLLEELDELIARHALDAWTPSLALEVWTALHQACNQLSQEAPAEQRDAFVTRADDAFEKICRIDVRQALPIAG